MQRLKGLCGFNQLRSKVGRLGAAIIQLGSSPKQLGAQLEQVALQAPSLIQKGHYFGHAVQFFCGYDSHQFPPKLTRQ